MMWNMELCLCFMMSLISILSASEMKVYEVTQSDVNLTSLSDLQIDGYNSTARTFGIDYENNTFLMNGEPFQYVSGSIHYFRCPSQYWRSRLRAMRAAGLNTISTYVEWSFHEPEYREYAWSGDKDLVQFINIAREEDLYVILRPGPYICAERDMGGFPYWLLQKYPNIKLRTNDEDYKREVFGWYSQLMNKMEPLLFGNGGPIIMVQVENEYGSFAACDREYTYWLARLTSDWVKGKALLFTTDGITMKALSCGSIPGVYATIDFGTGQNLTAAWSLMRKFSPKGPLVNSEYYPGWLTHWGEKAATVSTTSVVNTLDGMLKSGANVNFYMFYGGTNFGLTAGANLSPGYVADITSYDYDAPLTEAGDPTPKYFAIRNKIGEYMKLPDIPVPEIQPKGSYGTLSMTPMLSFLSPYGRQRMGKPPVNNTSPLTMEALGQFSGLVLYETTLPAKMSDPSLLQISDLRDRALIYIDGQYSGVLSRSKNIFSTSISPAQGKILQIIVENQGRVNYMLAEDFKGIRGNVLLDGKVLKNWNMTSYPLDWNFGKFSNEHAQESADGFLTNGPMLFFQTFQVNGSGLDTYVDMAGWGKGFVWINGHLLGRYWPGEGPQVTLYLPGVYLNGPIDTTNTLVVLEMEYVPTDRKIPLVDKANLGYPTRKS